MQLSNLMILISGLPKIELVRIFKEIFNTDSELFTKIIDASIIAQKEIIIEIEGIN